MIELRGWTLVFRQAILQGNRRDRAPNLTSKDSKFSPKLVQ